MVGLSIGLVVKVKVKGHGFVLTSDWGVIYSLSDDSDLVRVVVYNDKGLIVEDYYKNGVFNIAPFQFKDKVIDIREKGKQNVIYEIHSLKYNKPDSNKFWERDKPGLRAYLKPISSNGESVEFVGRSVETSYDDLIKYFEIV